MDTARHFPPIKRSQQKVLRPGIHDFSMALQRRSRDGVEGGWSQLVEYMEKDLPTLKIPSGFVGKQAIRFAETSG